MALRDLAEFFDPDLHLPIRGKRYRVPAPDTETSLQLRELVMTEGIPPVEQINQALRILGAEPEFEPLPEPVDGDRTERTAIPTGRWSGGVFDEMVADGIPWPMILHAGRTAMLHYGFSPDMAEVHWTMAQLGKLVDLERVAAMLAHRKPKPTTKE
ncbi:hypothetical protein [Rhodococcus ruber]|uniref:DUF7426 family protein n=1 Tax=Rhodococcus ruber TaxID=1830 RepID=UPI003784C810